MNKENTLYRWLDPLSVLLSGINATLLFLLIIYALVGNDYGNYSFIEIILSPEHIFILTFSSLSVLLVIIQNISKSKNKLIARRLTLITFILSMVAPIISIILIF